MDDPRSPRVRNAEETILDLHAEIERLRAEVELWKDRWAAADQELTATIKDYEDNLCWDRAIERNSR